ncbi:hypothetical protein LWI28_018105 [Acer negundo]|uniref:Uncharacterized protein n=1 Tax=Acer negundo TaxID=4023 RepID=A0AAD5J6W7_ACENE|nr:hypothetical protein LWI28_018105 [Acer negundo]
MMTCSSFPEPSENFKTEVRLPWTGEFKFVESDMELQELFKLFTSKGLETMRINIDLMSLATLPLEEIPQMPMESLHPCNPEPYNGCTMGDETESILDSHYSNSECDLDDEQLSNAASFHGDPDTMADLISDEGSPK